MAYCLLDNLPVELIHHLLHYFSTYEIFYSFTNVSFYIDNVLSSYSNYRVNFKSITKQQFDVVCQRIIPEQVISLTLSDDEDTPGQIERFLSRFQINQFTGLRSLTLINIGPDYWEIVMSKLIHLKNLFSFSYIPLANSNSWNCQIPYCELEAFDRRLWDTYNPVLPQLIRLRLGHGRFLISVQFPYLRHLIFDKCTDEIIRHICSAAPQLRSLETKLELNESSTELVFPFGQLNRLILRIEGKRVSMHSMEQMISNIPCLRYFELEANGHPDLADGQQWQIITSPLITFNFKFDVSLSPESQTLNSFRSPFWLDEKHWFVAYDNGTLFSVPYFAKTYSLNQSQSPKFSTLPDNIIFYEQITELTLSRDIVDVPHRFSHVHRLNVFRNIPLLFIKQIIDLNVIQTLCLRFESIAEYISIIDEMPNLNRISVLSEVEQFIEDIQCKTFEKIRTLSIGKCYMDGAINGDCFTKKLCSVFPHIEHLHVEYMCTKAQILDYINQFQKLTNASFQCESWNVNEDFKTHNIVDDSLALDKNRSSQKFDYTYRLCGSTVYLWL